MTGHEPHLAQQSPAPGRPLPALLAPAPAGAGSDLPFGPMADLVASTDWAAGPLGPPEGWPQSLRTAVGICLSSRFPILLWWGRELVMIYNDGYRPMLGRTKHPRALGAPGREVWPEIWDVIGPMLDQVMSGQGATWSDDQLLVLERNGHPEECYFTFSYSPVTDESGGVGGVFSVISETTERVLGERRLATLAEMAGLMGCASRAEVLHSATTSLATNPGDHPVALVLDVPSGTEPTDLPGLLEPQLSQHCAATVAQATDLVRQAVGSGRPARAPATEPTAGVRAWHAYPVADSAAGAAERRMTAVVLFGESPTRRWDPALEAYATLCATHVAAALTDVQALAEERRRHEALVALDRAKSTFFTNISHELRTPLTLITGPVREALATETDAARRARLELVERNAARLSRMVDAMLDFGRIEAGGLVPRPEPVDVSELGRGLAESFRPAVERAGLAFAHDCGDGIHACLDRGMLERVVLNLLSNAVKYTPAGSVGLEIREEGADVVVAVRDTGIGIHPDDVERAFARFERLPSVVGERSHEGAGLGLTMVRQLAELMGGAVSVCSEVGVGSTFTVRLPVAPAGPVPSQGGGSTMTPRPVDDFVREAESWAAPGPGDTGVQPAATRGSAGGGRRPRVLVAEDNADLRAYLADVLAADYDVEVVPDGDTAWQRVRAEVPDLLLTDVMMPGLDGYALVAAIRGEPALRDLPVVVLSARAGDEETSTALAAGADDYLVKPFSVVELRARVAGNLERAGARTQDAAWRRAVMDGFHDALVILALDGSVLEVNDRFTGLLGWAPADGPLTRPYPWDAGHPGAAAFEELVARVVADGGAPQAGESVLVARDGRQVPVDVRVGLVEGAPGHPARLLATVRDLTGEHEARERRATAAAVTAELAAADELTDVVAAAVTGLAVLHAGGEVTVDVVVGEDRHLFTAGGPVSPADLEPRVAEGLAGPAADGASPGGVDGIRLEADGAGLTCTVWVALPARRPVAGDERVAGDLIVQALALACDRVVLSSGFAQREQHLRRAIESHEEIGQAVGILVERHRLTAAVAFEQLKRASQNSNVKLREVARRVIESGADPGVSFS